MSPHVACSRPHSSSHEGLKVSTSCANQAEALSVTRIIASSNFTVFNPMPQKQILCVCLGNICRSPIAEAVFAKIIKERGLEDSWSVDSAALGGWHSGSAPDRRATSTLEKHEVSYSHEARQITSEDFSQFNYIFGMDEDNMKALKKKAPADSKAEILLLGSFDPEGDRIIRDPYYDDGDAGFEKCFQQCIRSCGAFLDKYAS